jgi:cytochrome P450
MTRPAVSLFDPAVIECPFKAYRTLREHAPAFEMAPGMFVVTRYHDVLNILKDTETFSSRSGGTPFTMFGPSVVQAQIDEILGGCPEIPTLLNNDPPEQSRIRSLVSKVFTARQVTAMEPRIRAIVAELAQPWVPRGQVEFVAEFARPLPSAVTADALGAEPSMRGRLHFWADEIMSRTAGPQEPDRQLAVARNMAVMNAYLLDLIRDRRRTPRGDLISLLAESRLDDGTALTDGQIVNVAETFLVGGNETTTFLLGSILHKLATDPTLADRMRAEPAGIPALVEEMLRVESPSQGMPRWPTRDVEIAGVAVPKGSTVLVMFGAANHDETVFGAAPLDLSRGPARSGRHVAFGYGAHFCLGAQLARAEARIALETLLPRMTDLTLDPAGLASRNQNPLLRGFSRLDLVFQST